MLFDSLLMSQTKLAYSLKEKTLKLILSVSSVIEKIFTALTLRDCIIKHFMLVFNTSLLKFSEFDPLQRFPP
jgi:hypothetical protein